MDCNCYKHKTMKAIRNLLIASLLLFATSCDELLQSDLTPAERLEGRWEVDETENPLKSADDAYRVYIDINPIDSNTVIISPFYAILNGEAYATISGLKLTLPEQDVETFIIHGSGTISANYNRIDWLYYVDDGSGYLNEVTAIYTKLTDY